MDVNCCCLLTWTFLIGHKNLLCYFSRPKFLAYFAYSLAVFDKDVLLVQD